MAAVGAGVVGVVVAEAAVAIDDKGSSIYVWNGYLVCK